MFIGEVLRAKRPYSAHPAEIDGYPNFYTVTGLAVQKGIHKIAQILAVDDSKRIPGIIISSSPHKRGSDETPWEDFFDPDNGRVRYCGDNKTAGRPAHTSEGNKLLLDVYDQHHSTDSKIRGNSPPLIYFERIKKGYLVFQGFGIVRGVQLITQFDHKTNKPFPNYVFDFSVFDLSTEAEEFNWEWIQSRRDPARGSKETNKEAPTAWQRWVREGEASIDRCERHVSKMMVKPKRERIPAVGTVEDKVLKQILSFYASSKHEFEALAAVVTGRVLSQQGGIFRFGWITPKSADGGADFIGRIDLGSDFASIKVIVLGQAKCQSPTTPTSGRDVARTVARLKRGWIGSYVTTSFFSEAVQREILEDQYPLLLVDGMRLAQEVASVAFERGISVEAFLQQIAADYDGKIERKRPEEILFD